MKYEDIKFFSERCEEHPDHQTGMVSHQMIQDRLSEEIDELREYIEETLKDKNMKSEQIKHSLSVGIKSIQSRVFDRETDEVISFVKIPIEDSGLVRCEWIELTDEEINLLSKAYSTMEGELNAPAFARAILRKAQEK